MGYDGTLKFDTKIETSGFSDGVSKISSLAGSAMKTATAAIGGAAAEIGALGTTAIKTGANFEASMSNVAAISGATGDEINALKAKAEEMGAKTKFSASESADAFSYMAMAGWKTADMLDGIEGIMNLAAASGEDLATTSDIVTDALTAFGMSASESGHFADILAAASSNANTNVSLMGETFKYVAPVAGALGFSAEDTAQAIGLMANAGIKGSQAGTALRSIMTRLAKPTKESQTAMDMLGLSLLDSEGNVKDLNTVMLEMRKAFSGCTEAEQAQYAAMIAGQEGMSGLLAIVNASESDYNKLSGAIAGCTDEATGYSAAEEMAAKQMDNLNGMITTLKSAIEGLQIKIYNEMEAPLKGVVQESQNMVAELTEAFTERGFEGLVSATGDILARVLRMVAEAAPKLIDLAVTLVHAFCESLRKADGVGESGVQLVLALIKGIVSVAADLIGTAIYLIAQLVIAFAREIPQLALTGVSIVSQLVFGIKQSESNLMTTAGAIVLRFLTEIKQKGPLIISIIQGMIIMAADYIRSHGPTILNAGMQLFSMLLQAYSYVRQKLLEIIPTFLIAILDFLNRNIPTILNAATKFFMSMLDAVPEVIAALNKYLPQFLKVGVDVITSLIDGIVQTLPKIIPAAVSIITLIIETITSNLPNVIEAAIKIVKALIDGLLKMLPTLLEAAITVFTALVQALPVVLDKLLEALPEIITAVINFLSDNIPTILNAGIELFMTLVEAIPQVIIVLLEHLPEIITAIVKGLAEGVPKILEAIGEASVTIAVALPELLLVILTALVEWFAGLLGSLVDFFSDVWTEISNWFTELPGKLSSFFFGLLSDIGSFFSDVINTVVGAGGTLSSSVSEIWNGIKDTVSGATDNLKSSVSTAWNNMKTDLEGIMIRLAPVVGQVWSEISSTAVSSANNLRGNIGEAWNQISYTISGAIGNIHSSVSNAWNNIYTATNNKMYEIKQNISGTWENLRSAAYSAWDGIKNAMTSPFDNAYQAISNSINRIRNLFDFNWSLPRIQLPHFDWTWTTFSDWGISLPNISVSWYKKAMDKGMILNNPTIFGAKNGKLLGGGEAGSETVVGTQSLMDMIRQAVAGVERATSIDYGDVNVNVYGQSGMEKMIDHIQSTVAAEMEKFSLDKTGPQEYDRALKERTSKQNVSVSGTLESDRPIEVTTNLYLDKRRLARELTPAIDREMYRIDNAENNRGEGG